jgi:uncharacterized protein YecE (DUF72 family)
MASSILPGCRRARHFEAVEVKATFYRLLKRSTVPGWVERTPPGFLVAIKAGRYVTHVNHLAGLKGSLDVRLDRLEPLLGGPRLGPLLW